MAGIGVQLLVNLAFILGADGFKAWSNEWQPKRDLSNSSFHVGSTGQAILGSFDVGLLPSTLAQLKGARFEGPTYSSAKKFYGAYELQEEEVLGRGKYTPGGVKVATKTLDGERVAVKQMDTSDASSHRVAYNELSILQLPAMQDIGGICHLEAAFCGPEENMMSLVLELASGDSLTEWWESQPKMSPDDYSAALPLIKDMLLTLVALHEHAKVCHGDIKPDNWRCADPPCSHIKLLDFGFSQQIPDLKRLGLSVKQGTPAYAAPELLVENAKYDERVDIWAFGSMVKDLFTPRPGSDLNSFASALMEVTTEDRPGARDALKIFRSKCLNSGEITGGGFAQSHRDPPSSMKRIKTVGGFANGLAGLGMGLPEEEDQGE